MDATEEFVRTLNDPKRWVVKQGVPIFKPHQRVDPNTQKIITVDLPKLYRIATNIQKLERAGGVPLRMTLGHTEPGKPETEQPPVAGYYRNARVQPFGPNQEMAVVVDEWLDPSHAKDRKNYPYRSSEYYDDTEQITGVALLARDPYLDLGVVAYSRPVPGPIRYAANGTVRPAHQFILNGEAPMFPQNPQPGAQVGPTSPLPQWPQIGAQVPQIPTPYAAPMPQPQAPQQVPAQNYGYTAPPASTPYCGGMGYDQGMGMGGQMGMGGAPGMGYGSGQGFTAYAPLPAPPATWNAGGGGASPPAAGWSPGGASHNGRNIGHNHGNGGAVYGRDYNSLRSLYGHLQHTMSQLSAELARAPRPRRYADDDGPEAPDSPFPMGGAGAGGPTPPMPPQPPMPGMPGGMPGQMPPCDPSMMGGMPGGMPGMPPGMPPMSGSPAVGPGTADAPYARGPRPRRAAYPYSRAAAGGNVDRTISGLPVGYQMQLDQVNYQLTEANRAIQVLLYEREQADTEACAAEIGRLSAIGYAVGEYEVGELKAKPREQRAAYIQHIMAKYQKVGTETLPPLLGEATPAGGHQIQRPASREEMMAALKLQEKNPSLDYHAAIQYARAAGSQPQQFAGANLAMPQQFAWQGGAPAPGGFDPYPEPSANGTH